MSPTRLLLSFLVLASAATAPAAQSALCFGPDGLTGPCCAGTSLNLPSFPALSASGIAPTWTNCLVAAQPAIVVQMSPTSPSQRCSELTSNLQVIDAANGNVVLSGTLVLDYTRTFGETTDVNPAPEYQVWRFAAKVDLAAVVAFGSSPPCTSVAPAFYYGYVDYARRCAGASWEIAVVLFHNCDAYMHDPALSAVPGAFHPDKTYALVAPVTAANPFNVANLAPIAGNLMDEGMRTLPVPAASCRTEDRLANGILTPVGQGCVCALGPFGGQQSANRFSGQGTCLDAGGNPGSWQALNLSPGGLPWVRLVASSIGNWTTGASYPGPETAAVCEGILEYRDACASSGAGLTFTDLFYGATTSRGYALAVPAGVPQPVGQVDLASNYSVVVGAPAVGPFLGRVLNSRHLIYTNVY